EAIEACDAAMRAHADWSLCRELFAAQADSRLEQTAIAQPAIFAIQVGLAALWRSSGIEPVAVVGHSMGEVGAAHVAGALSLDDAARVIGLRSQLMARIRGSGTMALVELSAGEALAVIAPHQGHVSIAASNSPS